MINKEKTIFTYTPEKLEIENVTKNNAKRNIIFKTKKNKNLKVKKPDKVKKKE
jgi:hypothetical protein